jgi:hypothetical protein
VCNLGSLVRASQLNVSFPDGSSLLVAMLGPSILWYEPFSEFRQPQLHTDYYALSRHAFPAQSPLFFFFFSHYLGVKLVEMVF